MTTQSRSTSPHLRPFAAAVVVAIAFGVAGCLLGYILRHKNRVVDGHASRQLQAAIKCARTGHWSDALSFVDAAVKNSPRDPEGYFIRAGVHVALAGPPIRQETAARDPSRDYHACATHLAAAIADLETYSSLRPSAPDLDDLKTNIALLTLREDAAKEASRAPVGPVRHKSAASSTGELPAPSLRNDTNPHATKAAALLTHSLRCTGREHPGIQMRLTIDLSPDSSVKMRSGPSLVMRGKWEVDAADFIYLTVSGSDGRYVYSGPLQDMNLSGTAHELGGVVASKPWNWSVACKLADGRPESMASGL